MCCSDRNILQNSLGAVSAVPRKQAASSPSSAVQDTSLPHLALPPPNKAVVVLVQSEVCEMSALACTQFLTRARASTPGVAGGVAVLGFDCEWSIRVTGARPVATIQLSAMGGHSVVFHIKPKENNPGVVPKALRELMTNTGVLLVSGPPFSLCVASNTTVVSRGTMR